MADPAVEHLLYHRRPEKAHIRCDGAVTAETMDKTRSEGEETLRPLIRMAHELNNLLTRILGHTDLAATKIPDDSRARPDLDKVRAAALEAAEVARRLRELGRNTP